MELERLYDPTYPDVEPLQSTGGRVVRRIGGYLMGDLSRAFAVAAFTTVPAAGILALPIGATAAAISAFASHKIYRPAYQPDSINEAILKKESRSRKIARIATSVGGVTLMGVGFGLFGVGFGNIFGSAHKAIPGLVQITAGYLGFKYGNRVVRGSFDPELFEDIPSLHTANASTATVNTTENTQPVYEYQDADFEGYAPGPQGVVEMNEDLMAEYKALEDIAPTLSEQDRNSRMHEITSYYKGLMQAHLDHSELVTV